MLDGQTSHSHKNHIGTFNDGNVKVVFMDSRRERYTQQVLCWFVKKKKKKERRTNTEMDASDVGVQR